MPDDVIFKLTTVYDGSQLAEGMAGSTTAIESDVAAWKEAFSSAFTQIEGSNAEVVASIKELTTAISTIPIASRAAAAETGGAFDLLSEHIVRSAGVAKLEAAGIGGAFSGLGALLGGGLVVGFAAHFLDETNKEVIALGNLATRAGFTISSMAGLQLTTRELGIDFSKVEQGLVRLDRAQALAVEGGKMQAEAFARIGLSVKEISNLSPEELFVKVSGAIKESGSSADVAASTFALLGRGGAALIPVFKEYGSSIGTVIEKIGEESGVTNQAYQEALKYQKVMADLGDQLRKIAIESLPILTSGIRWFNAILDESRGALGEIIIRLVEFAAIEKDAFSVVTGAQTWSQAYEDMRNQAALATESIRELNAETAKSVNKDLGKGGGYSFDSLMGAISASEVKDKPGGLGAPPPNRLEEWKLQLQKIQDATNQDHLQMLAQEVTFWDNILQTVKLKTAEEVEIRHTIATANREYVKEVESEVVRSYEEGARAAGEGTDKQKAILQNWVDYATATWGSLSAEVKAAQDALTKANEQAAEAQIRDLAKIAQMNEEIAAQEAKRAVLQVQMSAKDQQDAIIQRKDSQLKPGGTVGAVVDATQLGAQAAQQIAIAQSTASQEEAISEQLLQKQIASAEQVEDANTKAFSEGVISAQQYESERERIESQITKFIQEQATQREEIEKRLNDQLDKLDEQEAKKQMQYDQQISNSMARELDRMVFDTSAKTNAITRLWTDMVKSIIQEIIKMASEWLVRLAIMVIAKKAADAALDKGFGSADTGAEITSNVTQAESYAGLAAAAAFAGTLAASGGLDLPGAIAAGEIADAIGQVFAAQASAEGGWDLPSSGGPFRTDLHPDEMVLPSPLADRVRNMTEPDDERPGRSEDSGGITNFHYHAGDTHALDGTGLSDVLSRHPAQLAAVVTKLSAAGRLNLPRIARKAA
jgi:hypothetical protein